MSVENLQLGNDMRIIETQKGNIAVYDKAVKLIFLSNGFSLATILPHLPWIQRKLEIGDALTGFALLFPAIGAVSMMLLTGNLIQRYSSKRLILVGGILMQFCLPLLLLAPSFTFLATFFFCFWRFNGNDGHCDEYPGSPN